MIGAADDVIVSTSRAAAITYKCLTRLFHGGVATSAPTVLYALGHGLLALSILAIENCHGAENAHDTCQEYCDRALQEIIQ